MALALQEYLRAEAGTLGYAFRTLDKYGVKCTRHTEYPNLVLFKYSQVDSPMGDPVVQECRGIILDENDNWNVVAMTFKKFFNHGEGFAADIDWGSAVVFEKLDGSLIQLYHYAGKWHVSTSGVPDGTNTVGDFGLTFAQLFWETFESERLDIEAFDPEYTYAFELCAAENRVVVRHPEARLYLHGARHNKTLQEVDPRDLAISVRLAPWHMLYNLEDCLKMVGTRDPLKHEGYVVRDKYFNRIKIKSPAYLALHHAKDGLLSRKKMAMVIREGEAAELEAALVEFPELRKPFDDLKWRYGWLVDAANNNYRAIASIPDQKEFAQAAKENPDTTHFMFSMRKNAGMTPQTYMQGLTEPAYLRLLGVKE